MSKKKRDPADLLDIMLNHTTRERIKKSPIHSFFILSDALRVMRMQINQIQIGTDDWKKGIIKRVPSHKYGEYEERIDMDIKRIHNEYFRRKLDKRMFGKLRALFKEYINSTQTKESIFLLLSNLIIRKLSEDVREFSNRTFNLRTSCEFNYLVGNPMSNNEYIAKIASQPILQIENKSDI